MAVAEAQDLYLARFEQFLSHRAAADPSWLTTIRRDAAAAFGRLGFPTTRDEEWRFTNVAPITEMAYEAPTAPVTATRADLQPFLVRRLHCTLLVFVNGRYAAEWSTRSNLPRNSVVGSLGATLATDPGLVDPYFSRCAKHETQPFAALNTAFAEDGAFVHIPAGAVVQDPIHVLYFTTPGAAIVTHPRTILVVGDHSQVKLIEQFAGAPGAHYFTNVVTEIVGGEHSNVRHYRVQRESLAAHHVSSTAIYLEKHAVFTQQSFTLGGGLVRNDITAALDAQHIECTLNGLYLADGRRLVDNHTSIDHAKPNCASHEVYKGMLDGHARGVFNGKIFVREDAQKTDAKQTNQVLLLSEDATIDTKPQLEIFADDVKCTHGATVGQLDEDMMFYLRARGIGRAQARAMLIHAFASDLIDRVSLEPLREALEETLLGQLPKDAQI
jgi:Fe-S cluster assembly protein SufD